jgi:aspartate/methionine/tyrosine aminotransferase
MAQFPANNIISLVGSSPRYDLAESVGPALRLAELVDPAELRDLPLAYGTAAGDARLRTAIAEVHAVGPDDVVITVGGMHALFLLAFTLCDPGDEAVITTPLFPLVRTALEAVGARVRVLALSFDRQYRFDPRELRGRLSASARLICLASPQNPSGVAAPAATIRETLELMEEICPRAYLLVDETYREAAYGDDPIADTAVVLSPKVISVASLSKCHGAPGLRLGWVITRDPGLRLQLITAKFNTVVSCSAVDEALALKVLEHRAAILTERRVRLDAGLQRTAAWAQANNDFIDWVRPDAGALCCARLRPEVFDDAAVARFHKTLASRDARVANGTWFGDEARVFRLGFGMLPMAELGDALAAFAAAFKEVSDPARSSR